MQNVCGFISHRDAMQENGVFKMYGDKACAEARLFKKSDIETLKKSFCEIISKTGSCPFFFGSKQ